MGRVFYNLYDLSEEEKDCLGAGRECRLPQPANTVTIHFRGISNILPLEGLTPGNSSAHHSS